MHIDDNLRAGMSAEDARRRALLKLGGVESTRQAYRERSSVPLLEHLWQDLRFAVRQLTKTPGFTATAVITLALGMGAAVAIYAFGDAALVAPLPYRDPARLVYVAESTAQIPRSNLSYLDYLDLKRLNTLFSALDVFDGRSSALATPGGVELVPGARVSDGFFRTLGRRAALGRDFYAGEDLPGQARDAHHHARPVALPLRRRRDIVGQVVALSGVPHTIVGVLPSASVCARGARRVLDAAASRRRVRPAAKLPQSVWRRGAPGHRQHRPGACRDEGDCRATGARVSRQQPRQGPTVIALSEASSGTSGRCSCCCSAAPRCCS
jgi:hypothetical protein